MKKRRLNKKKVLAFIILILSTIFIIRDMIILVSGSTYTILGLISGLAIFNLWYESFDYLFSIENVFSKLNLIEKDL